jgi:formate dehydrogenase assembly factor FdhD
LFERTGGLHAAGLFTADGDMVAIRMTWAGTTQ